MSFHFRVVKVAEKLLAKIPQTLKTETLKTETLKTETLITETLLTRTLKAETPKTKNPNRRFKKVIPMEVEVKLRLPSAEAHGAVAKILKESHVVTHFQENVFFDGAKQELSSKRVTLRLRFYNNDSKCVVTIKGRALMVDGIGKATEEEEEIEPALGRACVDDPQKLLSLNCELLQKVVERYQCHKFVCLGGFRNVRMVFSWNNHQIELDETKFSFGTQYEIECETSEPERLRAELEIFLKEHQVPYAYSQATKFGVFRAGKLPEF